MDRVLTPVFYWSDWDRFPCDGEHPYTPLWISGYTSREPRLRDRTLLQEKGWYEQAVSKDELR